MGFKVSQAQQQEMGANRAQNISVYGSEAEYVRIIHDLKRAGCDAVALSCTEIPLLITPAGGLPQNALS